MYSVIIFATLLPIIGLFYFPVAVLAFVILPYIGYCSLNSHHLKDGRPWRYFSENFIFLPIFRSHIGLRISSLPKELIDAEKKEDAQFLIAFFPHGCSCDFRFMMEGMLPSVFPNIYSKCRALSATVLYYIPVVREMTLWSGCIDARRSVAEKAIDRGRTIIVLPGGLPEQIRTCRGREILYIKKRKGFIRLALKKKIPIVPSYVFGSSDLYKTSRSFYNLRYWLMNNLNMCLTNHSGLYGSWCPYPIQNTIVFGRPLHFEIKGAEPTPEEVINAHEVFCKALEDLFDEHKDRLGYGDRALEME